jgi:N-acetylneuraminic acid mutarotase
MAPRNKAGEPNDLKSTADVARFDPATGKWEALPPLPEPRSSHDVAVIDNTLYVVGGWNLRGKDEIQWTDSMLMLDLAAEKPEWKKAAQPFQRRALVTAANDGKLYVIGGFDENSEISKRLDIYEAKTGKWSTGPELPGDDIGFAPAAAVLDGKVYASFADGTVHRLTATAWERVGAGEPRLAHRMVALDGKLVIAGGATGADTLDLVEAIVPK